MSNPESSRRAIRLASRHNGRSTWKVLGSARLRAALSLGIVATLGAVSTSAYWTDQAAVIGGTFTAGKLDLKVGDPAVDLNPPKFTTDFAMTNMMPGSSKDAVLKVSNVGTVAFTYRVTAAATFNGPGLDQLGSAIRISVFPTANAGVCSGTVLVANQPASALNLDRPASLAALTGSESLCFRATLPITADTALQGKSTVVTLTLTASQLP